ncbi:hypothetical protein H4R18_001540 [Coemansia javaensis]|uniref:Protein kinase domain-containing protein n=1 Tax=Coemansia javaensis TaxID=2761396 RepID=A0A9W8LLE3_9FUNG|nr:hypothetical protein H4R18_001540 [Coemansia javaensis]
MEPGSAGVSRASSWRRRGSEAPPGGLRQGRGRSSSGSSSGSSSLASDCEDARLGAARTGSAALDRMQCAHAPIGHAARCRTHRHHRSHNCSPLLSRNRTVAAPRPSAAAAEPGTELCATIQANTQCDPMSSEKALRVFDAVFAAATHRGRDSVGDPADEAACCECASEALVVAHPAAARGFRHGDRAELRMNLGGGRNAVYVAPCEQHLECPLEKKGTYLVHTNKPKIMTDMSKVEFGICVDGWRRLAFKTVNDPELAKRELSFYHKTATAGSAHIIRLLDDFTDSHGRHVMVFPRMSGARIHGHDLADIAGIARQLFVALRDLHGMGIAHLDITPTNLMADPNDASHIEVIDFGLACDVSAAAAGGLLPSRGTCGFAAPEILAGGAKDLRADVYSAGVVLGMMLQSFLPTASLRLLGGPLVRSDTTDAVVAQLDELLEAYQYRPAQAAFVERNTTYAAPPEEAAAASDATALDAAASAAPTAPCAPASASASDDDDGAAALASVYAGGASLLGGYGNMSDSDEDDGAGARQGRFSGYNMLYGRTRGFGAQFHAGNRSHCSLGRAAAAHGDYDGNSSGDEAGPATRDGGRYRSPPNTPVRRREAPRGFDLHSCLSRTPETHSNARYAAGPRDGRRSSSSRTLVPARFTAAAAAAQDAAECSVGKPGRVPLAVLHAADLLRWTLQPEPQWRPTAAQALDHPFLRCAEPDRGGEPVSAPAQASAHAQMGAGAVHTCVHGAVVSECNSRASTPVLGAPAPAPAPPTCRAMFRESAHADVRLWEGEMHARLAHRDRAGADLHDPKPSSMYSDSCDDLTSYFC